MMAGKLWLVIAGFMGALAVAFGAFQSHGLESYLEPMNLKPEDVQERMRIFDLGVRYQIYNTLALAVVGAIRLRYASGMSFLSGVALLVGTLLFSGTLYYYATSGDKTFNTVAAFGGSTQIVGWLLFAFSALMLQPREEA